MPDNPASNQNTQKADNFPVAPGNSEFLTIEKEQLPKEIPPKVFETIPREVAERNQIVAFEKADGHIKVAIVDPHNIDALNTLRFIGEKENTEIALFQISEENFKNLLDLYSEPAEMVKEAVKSYEADASQAKIEMMDKDDGTEQSEFKEAPVTKLLEVIISHAIDGNASDIHIEPMDKEYRVRYRVDGVLHVSLKLPKEIGPIIISRVKIMANLKIDEKRKPQDGRFRITVEGQEVDFRISTLPVIGGEKVVMRILEKERDEGAIDIISLGLMGTAKENLLNAIEETYGMILMTGPTGSGKSTTLYSLLKLLNRDERNIVTLEDPIEYYSEGLNQSQIKPEIGYTFSSGLRTILRQDPNVIMVGEIRDSETAELAIHAALTGHLMLSTLHTNTAIAAIPRLIDMGIQSFLLAPSLRVVASQRLVRKICENCKEVDKVPQSLIDQMSKQIENVAAEELEKYGLKKGEPYKAYRGKGCEKCNNVGLKGRLAIFEVVPVDDRIRDMIIDQHGNERLITEYRDKKGLLSIRQEGIIKVFLGMTSISEVERVTEGKITLEEEND